MRPSTSQQSTAKKQPGKKLPTKSAERGEQSRSQERGGKSESERDGQSKRKHNEQPPAWARLSKKAEEALYELKSAKIVAYTESENGMFIELTRASTYLGYSFGKKHLNIYLREYKQPIKSPFAIRLSDGRVWDRINGIRDNATNAPDDTRVEITDELTTNPALALAIVQSYNYKFEIQYESGIEFDEIGILDYNHQKRRLAP